MRTTIRAITTATASVRRCNAIDALQSLAMDTIEIVIVAALLIAGLAVSRLRRMRKRGRERRDAQLNRLRWG